MALIPSYIPNKSHLPLELNKYAYDYLALINQLYRANLKAGDWRNTQVFKGADGNLHLDLVSNDEKEIFTFVDWSTQGAPDPTIPELPPDNTINGLEWIYKEVKVPGLGESLDRLVTGVTHDTMSDTSSSYPVDLARLLNARAPEPVWKMSSFAQYSTSKFNVIYAGPGKEAPEIWKLFDTDDKVLILNMLSGKNQGVICIRVIW